MACYASWQERKTNSQYVKQEKNDKTEKSPKSSKGLQNGGTTDFTSHTCFENPHAAFTLVNLHIVMIQMVTESWWDIMDKCPMDKSTEGLCQVQNNWEVPNFTVPQIFHHMEMIRTGCQFRFTMKKGLQMH